MVEVLAVIAFCFLVLLQIFGIPFLEKAWENALTSQSKMLRWIAFSALVMGILFVIYAFLYLT